MARDRNHKNGRFRRSETSSYKMNKHHGFDAVSWQAFQEAATEKYDFESCKQGEKMTFGKCQKVGGGGKQVPDSLKKSKATVEAELASAKKRKNKNQIRKAEAKLKSVNAKIDSYNASEETEFASGGCPDGFRSKGSQTVAGKRREVCCSSDGKICMTADGIPL